MLGGVKASLVALCLGRRQTMGHRRSVEHLVTKGEGDIDEWRTLLSINADAHPLLSGMHKLDSKLGPNRLDKRRVITDSRANVYR